MDDSGEILGRVNLVDAAGGSAELGYRIAEEAAGRGPATAAVREACGLVVTAYGLTGLRAETTLDNAASRAVLARTAFTPVGETVLDGRPGLRFTRDLRRGGPGGRAAPAGRGQLSPGGRPPPRRGASSRGPGPGSRCGAPRT